MERRRATGRLDFRLPPQCWWDLRSSGILAASRGIVYRRFGTTYRSHLHGSRLVCMAAVQCHAHLRSSQGIVMMFIPRLNPPVVSNVINGTTDPRASLAYYIAVVQPSQPWASAVAPITRLPTCTTHWIYSPKRVPINTDSMMQPAVKSYCKPTTQRRGHKMRGNWLILDTGSVPEHYALYVYSGRVGKVTQVCVLNLVTICRWVTSFALRPLRLKDRAEVPADWLAQTSDWTEMATKIISAPGEIAIQTVQPAHRHGRWRVKCNII
jgi:hypothetical protein